MRAPVALGRLCRHRNRATYVAIQWHACRWPRRLVLFPWIMDAQPASHSTGLDDDACLFMLTARASSASGDLRFARCAYALVTIRGKSLPVPAILCRVRVYQFLLSWAGVGRNAVLSLVSVVHVCALRYSWQAVSTCVYDLHAPTYCECPLFIYSCTTSESAVVRVLTTAVLSRIQEYTYQYGTTVQLCTVCM